MAREINDGRFVISLSTSCWVRVLPARLLAAFSATGDGVEEGGREPKKVSNIASFGQSDNRLTELRTVVISSVIETKP